MSDETKLSRRDFMKEAAVGAAAVAGAGLLSAAPVQAQTQPPAIKWDKEVDVVVVGYGGAGGAASIEAADAGANVLLLDKMPAPGGNAAMSSGGILAAGTPLQKALGIDDSPQKMYDYFMKNGMGVTDPELTRAICDNSASTLEWFTNILGGGKPTDPKEIWNYVANIGATPFAPDETVLPRCYMAAKGNGSYEFGLVKQAVSQRKGIEVLLETTVTSLITDGNGQVIGVKAQTKDGTAKSFKAARAVVLTTGDFSRNDEMTKAWSMESYYAAKQTHAGATGDGIKMALELGAALACMEGTMGGTGSIAPNHGGLPGGTSFILVNGQGARYVNEGSYYANAEKSAYYIAYRSFQQDNRKYFAIFDQAVGKNGGKGLAAGFSDDLAEEIAKGYVFKADTVEELATKCGMAPAIFRVTIDIWNEDVANGKDRLFGRMVGSALRGASKTVPMAPIKDPPFYAVPLTGTTITTLGGVKTNGKAQVINVRGQVIPRLYAAGSTVGGFMGPFYQLSGGGLCQAYTMGRIAGKTAATEKPGGTGV